MGGKGQKIHILVLLIICLIILGIFCPFNRLPKFNDKHLAINLKLILKSLRPQKKEMFKQNNMVIYCTNLKQNQQIQCILSNIVQWLILLHATT